MEILTKNDEGKIVAELLKGKTVVFPTETSYGLLCDATNAEAVKNVFEIKGRSHAKSLLVVVPSVEIAKKYLKWNEQLDKIAEKYWPGAVTVVSEVSFHGSTLNVESPFGVVLAEGVISKDETVAMRVTDFDPLKSLVEKVGRPLVATSANVSGNGEVYSEEEVILNFGKQNFQPDYVVDFGEISKRKPTTIVRVFEDKFEVLRQGEVNVSFP